MPKTKIKMNSDIVPLAPMMSILFAGSVGGWVNAEFGLIFALPIFLIAVLFWGHIWINAGD